MIGFAVYKHAYSIRFVFKPQRFGNFIGNRDTHCGQVCRVVLVAVGYPADAGYVAGAQCTQVGKSGTDSAKIVWNDVHSVEWVDSAIVR